MTTLLNVQRRKFLKFVLSHGHARDPEAEEGPLVRAKTAIYTIGWWAQSDMQMPNTAYNGPDRKQKGAILTAESYLWYLKALNDLTPTVNGKKVMRHIGTLKLTKFTTKETLQGAWDAGCRHVKIYPENITTSNDQSVYWKSFSELYKAIGYAAEIGFFIHIHAEQPEDDGKEVDTYFREPVFMKKNADELVKAFPGARFNIEHISRRQTLEWVGEKGPNITGGLTLQHITGTANDLLEWKVEGRHPGLQAPHHMRPPLGWFEDRDALSYAALHAHLPEYEKFHFGPDNAAHLDYTKFAVCGCAGGFVSAALGPHIVHHFDKHNELETPALEAFTVRNPARIFGWPVDEDAYFELEKAPWPIPLSYGGVSTFFGGRELSWRPIEPAALNPELLLAPDYQPMQ